MVAAAETPGLAPNPPPLLPVTAGDRGGTGRGWRLAARRVHLRQAPNTTRRPSAEQPIIGADACGVASTRAPYVRRHALLLGFFLSLSLSLPPPLFSPLALGPEPPPRRPCGGETVPGPVQPATTSTRARTCLSSLKHDVIAPLLEASGAAGLVQQNSLSRLIAGEEWDRQAVSRGIPVQTV